MKISKTTLNFAERRGICLNIDNNYDAGQMLEFYEDGNDCEPFMMYLVSESGFSFYGNAYLKQEVKEELPAFIRDEKQLRSVIDYIKDHI